MTKQEFFQPFTLLCEMYNREASQLLAQGYYLVLQDLSKQEFEEAIKQILSSRKYSTLPLPADLLEAVHGNPDDKAILALKQVEDAMSEQGSYKSVCFEDKISMTCIENLGGWVTICQMELKDWEWKKKEFITLYKAIIRNPQNIKQISYLVGKNEHNNRISGYDEEVENQEVFMIGFKDSSKVLAIDLKRSTETAQISTNDIEGKIDIGLLAKNAVKGF